MKKNIRSFHLSLKLFKSLAGNPVGFSVIQVMVTAAILTASSVLLTQTKAYMSRQATFNLNKNTKDRLFNELSLLAADPDAIIISSWYDSTLNTCVNPVGSTLNEVLATLSTRECPAGYDLNPYGSHGENQSVCCIGGSCSGSSAKCPYAVGAANGFTLYDRKKLAVAGPQGGNPIYYDSNGFIVNSSTGPAFQATAALYLNNAQKMQIQITVAPVTGTVAAALGKSTNDGTQGQSPAIMNQYLGSVALKQYTTLTGSSTPSPCVLGQISSLRTGLFICAPLNVGDTEGTWQSIPNPHYAEIQCTGAGGQWTTCAPSRSSVCQFTPNPSSLQQKKILCPSDWSQFNNCSITTSQTYTVQGNCSDNKCTATGHSSMTDSLTETCHGDRISCKINKNGLKVDRSTQEVNGSALVKYVGCLPQ